MADLLTHLASAQVPAAFLRDRRVAALLVVGTFLPDFASKGLYWLSLADPSFTYPSHSLTGLVALCYLATLFLEERLRRPGFAALYVGSLLHLAVDLLKDNSGQGAAYLLYPFSTHGTEFGLVDPENVIFFLPFDAVLLLGAWLLERKLRRVRE